MEAVVDAAGLERFALLGISQGGVASIAYCLRHPERVSHLILYGSVARPFMDPEFAASLVALVRLGWDMEAVRQVWTMAFIPDGGPEEMRWFNEFQRETASAAVAARVLQANLELDAREIAPKVSMPTLVVHRREDGVVPFDQGRELASLIPGARFLPLGGKNHLFLQGEEELSEFVAAIDEFVRGDSAAVKPAEPALAQSSTFRAVLFTDLVGHTEMMSRLGDEVGRAVLRDHEDITRNVLKTHGGTEVKTMGDGFMASFGSVTRAVECAIALQRAFDGARTVEPTLTSASASTPASRSRKTATSSAPPSSSPPASPPKPKAAKSSSPTPSAASAPAKASSSPTAATSSPRASRTPCRIYEVRWSE